MVYDANVLAILREYKLVDEQGNPVEGLSSEGVGPKLNPDVIERFIKADTTPNKQWLGWALYQAAGGNTAKEASERAIQKCKERFVAERLEGFKDDEGVFQPPVKDKEVIEQRWANVLPQVLQMLSYADEDLVSKMGVLGFYRKWNNTYASIISALEKFLKLYKKTVKMNQELVRDNKEPVPVTPEAIESYKEMERLVNKVERYYASRTAREDIRFSKWNNEDWIYNDDYVTAIAPLTHAAAVKYGWDTWPWANRDKFDAVLASETDRSYDNVWKTNTERGKAYVYIRFNQPVPRWVSRVGGKFKLVQLTNLALELDTNQKGVNPANLVIYDEEGRNTLRLDDVKQMILSEPGREQDASDEEMPIKRGPNVLKTTEEAEEVIKHLDACIKEIVKWAARFDPKTIKKDAMTLD